MCPLYFFSFESLVNFCLTEDVGLEKIARDSQPGFSFMRRAMDAITAFHRQAQKYDHWFQKNRKIYDAETGVLLELVPRDGTGLEVGVGTGRFSSRLGIGIGVEPAGDMAKIARSRNISVCRAAGEYLPFCDRQFDFVLLVTVLCFVKDVPVFLQEMARVLRIGGRIILAFIDKESDLGRLYETRKVEDDLYRYANFFSVQQITTYLSRDFNAFEFYQTLHGLPEHESFYQVSRGYGMGAFVAVAGRKSGKSC